MTDGAIQPALRRAQESRSWRRRSRQVRLLRRFLPALVGLILLVLSGYLALAMLTGPQARPVEAGSPIQLVNPRFIARTARGAPSP